MNISNYNKVIKILILGLLTIGAQTAEARSNVVLVSSSGHHALPAPIANAGGPYTGNPGVAINFDGSKSTSIGEALLESYRWTFSDGTSATGVTITHTFANPGRYQVRLRVTDSNNLTHSQQVPIVILEPEDEDDDQPL